MNKRVLRTARTIFGYLIAAALLVWVFHDIHPERLRQHIAAINWQWVALAIVLDNFGYICGGLRWHLLLHPVGHVPVWRTAQAIYSGIFLNEVLPLRIGELARGYLVSLWLPAKFAQVIPSMALERLLEAIWLALGIGITAILVPLPQSLVRSFDILGAIVLSITVLFVFFIIRGRKAGKKSLPPPKARGRLFQSLSSLIQGLAGGFRDIGLSPTLYGAFLCTFGVIASQAAAFWFIMLAYGINLSIWVGAAVYLIVLLGTAVPNAPANIGSYQFFCVVGLTIFGVDKTLAAGFSVVVFIILTIPLLVIGFLALSQSGLTLSSIKERVKNLGAHK